MAYVREYPKAAPSRADIDASAGALALEFGTGWCGHCIAAQPWLAAALADAASLAHVKVEDGKGRPLGRSFGVRLWPTVVFLRDGVEVARVVRPTSVDAVREAVAALGDH